MTSKKIRTIWTIVLCIMLALGLTTVSYAQDETQNSEVQSEEVQGGEAQRLYEVKELREKNSKTYLLDDGSYQYVGYAEDIHYEDSNGSLVEINNAITESHGKVGYRFANTAHAWRTYFSDNLSQKDAVVLEKGEYSVSFRVANAQQGNGVQKSTAMSKGASPFDEMLSLDNRAVVYQNVYNNVDIAYTAKTAGLKEDIILRDASAPNTYLFDINLKGVTPVEKDGLTFFKNGKGEVVFELAPMYMEDANGKYSDKVSYSIEQRGTGYRLTVTADADFLNATDTIYPVVIDPSVMVTGSSNTYDSCVDQQYPTSNYYLSQNLWTGGLYNTNAMRTFIKFTLPTNISSTDVTSAYLRVEKTVMLPPGSKRTESQKTGHPVPLHGMPNRIGQVVINLQRLLTTQVIVIGCIQQH